MEEMSVEEFERSLQQMNQQYVTLNLTRVYILVSSCRVLLS